MYYLAWEQGLVPCTKQNLAQHIELNPQGYTLYNAAGEQVKYVDLEIVERLQTQVKELKQTIIELTEELTEYVLSNNTEDLEAVTSDIARNVTKLVTTSQQLQQAQKETQLQAAQQQAKATVTWEQLQTITHYYIECVFSPYKICENLYRTNYIVLNTMTNDKKCMCLEGTKQKLKSFF